MADQGRLSGVTGTTRLTAVIGAPVVHSLSPVLMNAAFAEHGLDWMCVALEVADGDHGLRWPLVGAFRARRQALRWMMAQLSPASRPSKWKRRKKKR